VVFADDAMLLGVADSFGTPGKRDHAEVYQEKTIKHYFASGNILHRSIPFRIVYKSNWYRLPGQALDPNSASSCREFTQTNLPPVPSLVTESGAVRQG